MIYKTYLIIYYQNNMAIIPNKIYKMVEQSGIPHYQIFPGTNTPYGYTEVSSEQALREINEALPRYQGSKQFPTAYSGLQEELRAIQNMNPSSGNVDSWTAPWGEVLTNVPLSQIQQIEQEQRDVASGKLVKIGTSGSANVPLYAPAGTAPVQPQTLGSPAPTIPAPTTPTTPQSNYTGPSIVDYLNSVGQASDYASRARLAQQYGIQNYTGTGDQNTQLLGILRGQGVSQPLGQNAPQGANNAPQSDIQGQLADKQAQLNALQKYGLTDTNQLTKDASGNYVPATPTNSTDSILKQYGLDVTQNLTIDQIITKISDAFGLGEIKKSLQGLTDNYAEQISKINDNPWLSEAERTKQTRLAQDKFETKKNAIYEQMKAEQPMVAAALDLYQQQQTNKQQILLQAMKDKSEQLNKTTTDLTEYNFAKGQGYKGTFEQWQRQQANLKATASGTGGLTDYQQTQTFLNISNKYQADEIIKQAINGKTAVSISDQVIANPNSATQQLASLYLLVKNLDPTSAVREGELALANQTQSYLQQFGNTLARIGEGRVISPEAAVELAKATKNLANAWNSTANYRTQQYISQANTAGVGVQFGNYLGGYGSNFGSDANVTPENQQTMDSLWSETNQTQPIQTNQSTGNFFTNAAQGIADWLRGLVGLQ
jgi:hypothetical protein